MIAAVQELNDTLLQELKNNPDIKSDLPKELFKSPFSEHEKLYHMSPQRMLQAMQERGVVDEVKKSNPVLGFIQFKDNYKAIKQDATLKQSQLNEKDEQNNDKPSIKPH